MGKQRGCYQSPWEFSTYVSTAEALRSPAAERSFSSSQMWQMRNPPTPINPQRALSSLTAGRLVWLTADVAACGLGARRGCWVGRGGGQQLEEQRPVLSSERLPRDPGAPALPLHQLARPRCPLLRHRPPGLCPPGQVPQPPGSRAHSGPLQVSERPPQSKEASAALLSRRGVLQWALFSALSAPCLCPLCPALSDETRVLRPKQPQ